jgi:hypothetical protein
MIGVTGHQVKLETFLSHSHQIGAVNIANFFSANY